MVERDRESYKQKANGEEKVVLLLLLLLFEGGDRGWRASLLRGEEQEVHHVLLHPAVPAGLHHPRPHHHQSQCLHHQRGQEEIETKDDVFAQVQGGPHEIIGHHQWLTLGACVTMWWVSSCSCSPSPQGSLPPRATALLLASHRVQASSQCLPLPPGPHSQPPQVATSRRRSRSK